jgi:hypothetical protein
VLVLAQLAGLQNGDGWFKTPEVSALFQEFRVPTPPNISARLGDLRTEGFVINRTRTESAPAAWSLTPLGAEQVIDILGELDWQQIAGQIDRAPGADLAEARQTVLPPTLAPVKWAAGIARLLDRHPFETNVLCMTRFPRPGRDDDPNEAVIDAATDVLAGHGLTLHLASDAIVDEDLFSNIAAYMWACQYGLGLFENRVGEGLNYNLVIEVGAMVMAGRRCALLRDELTVERMPTDLVGHIYKSVDFGDVDAVSRELHLWASQDLGLGRCRNCP